MDENTYGHYLGYFHKNACRTVFGIQSYVELEKLQITKLAYLSVLFVHYLACTAHQLKNKKHSEINFVETFAIELDIMSSITALYIHCSGIPFVAIFKIFLSIVIAAERFS